MGNNKEYFLAFKKAYLEWVHATMPIEREHAWYDYCHARDLFFGTGYGLKDWGIIPVGES